MRIHRTPYKLLAAMLMASMVAAEAAAWNPPPGPSIDQATPPRTPTTLLKEAHGYITQNGIAVLNNDGYWFAAQMLQQWQQELLNGVRYADVYDGRQKVVIEACALVVWVCEDIYEIKDWPLAADNHYFNPDTNRGLDPGLWNEVAFWAKYLPPWVLGIANIHVTVRPALADGYPSALHMFDVEYRNALSAYADPTVPGIGGRKGTALAMLYLGWGSHLLQDLTVVHHTFDEGQKHHQEYENSADGLITSAPVPDGRQIGIYDDQLPIVGCAAGSRTCFASYAANVSHDRNVLDAADDEDYSNVRFAIPFAQSLQAGLYRAFLTDVGLRPVHMSAVMAVL
jgi:hypothetical protein